LTILRAGLIGLGMMGRHHARILSRLDGVDFIGSCDLKAESSVYGYGKPVFNDLEQLLRKKIDYAVIAVPTHLHSKIASILANEGVNALIEKPLAQDVSTAIKVAQLFEEKGILGAVGHIERFNPAVREAKSRLDLLGSIYQISTTRVGPFPGRVADVGVTKDLATHDIDVTTWISGQKFKTISAKAAHKSGRANEDMLLAIGTLSKGAITSHNVNWLSPRKQRLIVITGENGSFEIDTLQADLTYFSNGTSKTDWEELARFKGVSEGDVIKFAFEKKEPLLIEHEGFRDLLLGKQSDIVSLQEGIDNLLVAEAMLESVSQVRTVSVLRT
jgi:UDP-N-acetylglucosamine 3-dehydrogenase